MEKALKNKKRKPSKSQKTAIKKHKAPIQIEEITFQPGELIQITPDMIIGDVVLAFPETFPVLQSFGIHCIGCYASTFESIEEGVSLHGLDPEKVCHELNKAIHDAKNTHS